MQRLPVSNRNKTTSCGINAWDIARAMLYDMRWIMFQEYRNLRSHPKIHFAVDVYLARPMNGLGIPPSESRGDKSLALVHTDLCEFPVRSRTHNTWMMTFLDDFAGYGTIFFLKKKLDADTAFRNWFAWAEKSSGNKLLKLRLDHGGEYMSSALWNFLSKNGIKHQKTVPHMPQQNGRAERFNRMLLDKSEAMRQHACLPPTFWQDAIETSLHIYNRQPMCCLNWYSPIQLWNGTKPDVSYFRTFGCRAYVFIPKDR